MACASIETEWSTRATTASRSAARTGTPTRADGKIDWDTEIFENVVRDCGTVAANPNDAAALTANPAMTGDLIETWSRAATSVSSSRAPGASIFFDNIASGTTSTGPCAIQAWKADAEQGPA